MPDAQRHLPTAEVERQLLAALCSARLESETRAAILERLAAHTFVDSDHEIIFQALAKMPSASSEQIRETLSARLTRLGFPDIEVGPVLELPPPPPDKIKSLLQQLNG